MASASRYGEDRRGRDEGPRWEVVVTDETYVERHPRVDWIERNRLADFAYRHGYRYIERPADSAAPERRTYR